MNKKKEFIKGLLLYIDRNKRTINNLEVVGVRRLLEEIAKAT